VKVLALDYGRARTGVAVSDPTGTIARPLCVVEGAATGDGLARLAALIGEHEVDRVVVGLPLTLRGERGEQARETERFIEALNDVTNVPVVRFDERFTTDLAEQTPADAPEDARAAAHLLSGYLTWASSGVIPPRQGRPPQGPSPRQVTRRRVLALGVLVLVLGGLGWLAVAAIGGGNSTDPVGQTSTLSSTLVYRTVTRTTATGIVETVIAMPKPFHVVFPEGFTRKQMAERVAVVAKIAARKRRVQPRLSRAAYLAATVKPRVPSCFRNKVQTVEGFLFPATYEFFKDTTSSQLVRDQLDAFCENWKQIDLGYARSKNLTPYDVLIIASMVEKETLSPDERQLVSAVIYNRLHAGMPLGIDATLRYGLNIQPTESIHQSQLQSDSPYNTRKRRGLPPTPIANPGLASLQAAAHPAKVKYLYFVRKPDKKHHFFTSSYKAFQQYANAHGYGP